MALALSAETEDLLTCSVCLIEYDREERRPKFLQCAHTACIKCLEVILLLFFNRVLLINRVFSLANLERRLYIVPNMP